MLNLLILVVAVLVGWGLGKTSNGMTSPRQAFNLYTGPTTGVIGGVIALVFGGLLAVFTGFCVGLVGGLIGLGAARLMRGR